MDQDNAIPQTPPQGVSPASSDLGDFIRWMRMTPEQKQAADPERVAREEAEFARRRAEEEDRWRWRRLTPAEQQAEDAERFARDEAERAQEAAAERAKWVSNTLERLDKAVGPRYRGATLDTYKVTNDAQRAVVAALRGYADDTRSKARAGCGVVLFGSVGTGKDHLLIALARIAIERHAADVEWIRGADLFGQFRDAMDTDTAEEFIIAPLVKVGVLILSDPIPAAGSVTPFQADILLRIIDERYRAMRPTWVALNVACGAEADQRLGAQVADRMRDGALCLFCKWESYRRPILLDVAVMRPTDSKPEGLAALTDTKEEADERYPV